MNKIKRGREGPVYVQVWNAWTSEWIQSEFIGCVHVNKNNYCSHGPLEKQKCVKNTHTHVRVQPIVRGNYGDNYKLTMTKYL